MPDEPLEAEAILEEAEEIEEVAEDIDELSEQLAVHAIISEERHEEILGEVAECRSQMESLLSRMEQQAPATAAESPVLAQVSEQMTSLLSRMEALEAKLAALSKDSLNPTPSPSVTPEAPASGGGLGVPPVVSAPPKRKRPIL